MIPIDTRIDSTSDTFATQRAGMQALTDRLRALEQRAVDASSRARSSFQKRGALLPRERV
ncbi:MAG TPA: acetyl-CoA carboxylase carboxyltransferase subunit, partial [Cupriavidus sp.]|nr:acetyl-CoA carboxylase carboxyltransferase subunit [Cupriavidus sp.]